MSALTLGFIALTDAAPLIVARARGLLADEGLAVTLQREASWATLRDKVAVGALDGAHMLAPMALAASAGVSGPPTPMIAPLALAVNGSAITFSSALIGALKGEEGSPAALARLIAARAARGAPPLTFAVVFPFSIHNYALRYWLASGGVDPDRDVRIVVVPPARMVAQLRAGEVDGVCVGAPWNAVAEAEGLGRIVLPASRFWSGCPDKVLGVTEAFAKARPDTVQALLRALIRAQVWADQVANREELIALLALPEHVDAPPQTIRWAVENELAFNRGGASLPRLEHARWFLGQMRRWGQIGEAPEFLAAQVYRPDLTIEALEALGLDSAAPPIMPLFDAGGGAIA